MKAPFHVWMTNVSTLIASRDATRHHEALARTVLGIASALEITGHTRQAGAMVVRTRESTGPHDLLIVRIVSTKPLLVAEVAEATLAQVGEVCIRRGPRHVQHTDCGCMVRWSTWRAWPTVHAPGIAGTLVPTRTCERCRSTVSAAKLEVLSW